MTSENLNILEAVEFDDSISSYQYIEKEADQGANLNAQNDIIITFENRDAWLLPSKSYLLIEGTIQSNAGADLLDANGASRAFVNNGLMFLFSNCKYFLGGQQIEYFDSAGVTTTIHNLLTRSKTYQGLEWMWQPDSFINEASNSNSGWAKRHIYLNPVANRWEFSCTMPLNAIFNFCNDYTKTLYGMQHRISLNRTDSRRALFRAAGGLGGIGKYPAILVGAGPLLPDTIVNLTNMRWAMPIITPSVDSLTSLLPIIKDQIPLKLAFLNKTSGYITVPQSTLFTWSLRMTSGIQKARYFVIGFQTARGVDQLTNSASFDVARNVLNVREAYLTLNGIRYPYANVGTDLATNKYAKWYYNYVEFFNKYHNYNGSEPCLSYLDFINCYPLYVFDVSHQSEQQKMSTIDAQLQMTFSANAPADTQAFCVFYFDSLYQLTGDDKNQVINFINY